MTICQQCNGAGGHQGIVAPVKDKKGGSIHKPSTTGSSGSSVCSGCGGTGILRSFGV